MYEANIKLSKMYRIEIPDMIHQITALFYQLRMWSIEDVNNLRTVGPKLFHFIYFVCITISIGLGAFETNDKDEFVYLFVVSITCTIQDYRIWCIIWEKSAILTLINRIGTHYTDDEKEFHYENNKLKMLMKFIRYFTVSIFMSLICSVVLPVANDKQLFFNIAFPLDRTKSESAFWITYAFLTGGMFVGVVCCFLTLILWYLMMSFVTEYKILGNKFRNLGATTTGLKASTAELQKLYLKDFIVAIKSYEKINRYDNTK